MTAGSDDVTDGKPAPDRTRGVACVGLLCGGIPRADLEEAGARAVYRHPAALLAHLDRSPFAAPRRACARTRRWARHRA